MDEVTLGASLPRPHIQATADGKQFMLVVRGPYGSRTEYGPIHSQRLANRMKRELNRQSLESLTRLYRNFTKELFQ